MKRTITAAICMAALAGVAGVPVKWSVETSRADERVIDVYHGESLDIEVTFKSYGEILTLPTNETAATFWQTNGMNTAYWRTNNVEILATNGIMKTTFGPEQDVGAKTLRGFIGIPGQIYRAAFVLRFKDAPGYNVAIVEWPYRLLDFATIEVVNPPYYTQGETDSRIEELAGSGSAEAGQTMTNTLTEAAKLYARMDGESNERRFKNAWGKQGSSYRGTGIRYVDQYMLGGLFGMDYGTARNNEDVHFRLWTQDLYGDEEETNEILSVYATLPVSMKDGAEWVYAPGMKVPGDYGQIPWYALRRGVDAYGRVGSVFSYSDSYINHGWTADESAEIELHHPNVKYVNSAIDWTTNYIAKYGTVGVAERASGLRNGADDRTAAEVFAKLDAATTTNEVCDIVTNEVQAFNSPWNFSPSAPEGFWYYMLYDEYMGETYWLLLRLPLSVTPEEAAGFNGDNESEWGMYHIDEYSGATRLDAYVHFVQMGSGITASREVVTRNALGLARLEDITNTVTKAYIESMGIDSEETDPVWTGEKAEYAKTGTVNEVRSVVKEWEGYWDGTNVIFEVTNYYGNTSGEIPRLRIKELREGSWQTVWDEADKFKVCESNLLDAVSKTNQQLKTDLKGEFAPLAWGSVTDKGTPNVISNSVWMTSPETYFAGGTEYQRVAVGSGTICVLVDNGAGTYTAGEEGTFRFQDEGGTNYFGFAKSDSYTIGCNTDGITVEGTLVTLRYDVIMGGSDVPIVYYRETLSGGEWTQLNNADGTATAGAPYTVTWYQDGGSYYAAINCGGNPSGFFKAETSVAGDVVFETNMKARLGGGIECENTANGTIGVIRPTYNGSTVTWSWSAR